MYRISLPGCATDTGVVQLSGNTYMISKSDAAGAFSNLGALKAGVIREANAFAESKGKVAVARSANMTIPAAGFPNFEYQFALLDKDDPRANGVPLNPPPSESLPINTQAENVTPKSSGSGVIISAQGLALTAAHVVADAKKISVITAQGIHTATVLCVDESNDIAVLKIEGGPYVPLTVAPSRGVRLGQGVATIGFPNVDIQGFSPKVTRGEISSVNGFADDPRSWQISVPVQPGNSGGPLLDEDGNIIGIVEAKLGLKVVEATGDIPQNVNYAVKSAYALALLEPYMDSSIPQPNQSGQKPSFEDMIAKAQQSVVLILVY
ncbi:MAG TPA: serine protease [Opitutaceae bacterium]|jgi:S1-C subfamily serine protease|nr:serine protease [Opitutaceae bacterium]